jgi:hypothetical protein
LVYTDGTTNTTVNGILVSPYVFSVTPLVTTTYNLISVADNFCTGIIGSGSVTITVGSVPLPFAMTVTDGGSYCEGTPGPVIGLAGTQNSISYQLLYGFIPVGFAIPGNGGPISFGTQATPGTYRVRATDPGSNCQTIFSDSVVVVEHMKPIVDFLADSTCDR